MAAGGYWLDSVGQGSSPVPSTQISENSGPMHPLRKFPVRSRCSRLVKLAHSGGMGPMSLLPGNSSDFRFVSWPYLALVVFSLLMSYENFRHSRIRTVAVALKDRLCWECEFVNH